MSHHLPDPTPQQRHHRGDHTACRPSWCLAARADHGTQPAGQPEPHTAWPSAWHTLAEPPTHGATDVCAVCSGPVEYVIRLDDRQRYGALSGRVGWRHQPAQPAEGGEQS